MPGSIQYDYLTIVKSMVTDHSLAGSFGPLDSALRRETPSMHVLRLLPFSVLLAAGLASCGGSSGESSTSDNTGTPAGTGETDEVAPTPATVVDWDASKGTVSVSGTVRFEGDPPKRRKVDMGSDDDCIASHTEPPPDEFAVIGDDGGLKDVLVCVTRGLEGWSFPVPTEPAQLNQVGCTYKPHMLAVRVGQPLEIANGDPLTHNVHSFAKKNKSFNQSQSKGSDNLTRTFTRTELLVSVKCDIHGWMNTSVGVVDNPFHAVTGPDGTFDLGSLPPGEYTIEAHHGGFGRNKEKVTLVDGEAKTLDFTFSE